MREDTKLLMKLEERERNYQKKGRLSKTVQKRLSGSVRLAGLARNLGRNEVVRRATLPGRWDEMMPGNRGRVSSLATGSADVKCDDQGKEKLRITKLLMIPYG